MGLGAINLNLIQKTVKQWVYFVGGEKNLRALAKEAFF